MVTKKVIASTPLSSTPEQAIADYRLAFRSRQASVLGRHEVLSGRAKFGAFGDGKELAHLAMARAFRKGDWRSGYYRDQTLMFALGELTIPQYFAQLYAHANPIHDPASAGRMMGSHFVTHSLNPDGTWRDLAAQYNSAADISPTAGQMPRLVGLAHASRVYRELAELKHMVQFSQAGQEVAWGIIGNASTAEGLFWEAVNAIGVLRAPAVITILDDGYGISVPNEHQITKGDLSQLLAGFQREKEGGAGYDVYRVAGWDYEALCRTFAQAAHLARQDHVPSLVHVVELTQPQGHSTSGSHERYKSAERLQWERDHDGLTVMRHWLLREEHIDEATLKAYEAEDKASVRAQMREAWQAFIGEIGAERAQLTAYLGALAQASAHHAELNALNDSLYRTPYPKRKDILEVSQEALRLTRKEESTAREALRAWRAQQHSAYHALYERHLYSETPQSPLHVRPVAPVYSPNAPDVNGFQILNAFYDTMLAKEPRLLIFGEDVGYLGGVNQSTQSLQAKYGALRVADTGIREATIVGQAIGLALRGLRPIAEIQYLDYLLYALQILSDDVACLRWRTHGAQSAPLIISTRGHRLEGIWHSGSQMAGILNLVHGMHLAVPRDMTRAVGFYHTLLLGDDPAIVVEPLNGYRKKEKLPNNLSEICLPLGVPEVLREGQDVTLVTYGALCHIALEAADVLAKLDVQTEVIDVQTLLPFDVEGRILASLKKTNRILFLDEDVPGGATAYMMQKVLEEQGGYHWLDAEPRTLSAKAHRPAYGTDGNYFSKPNREDIVNAVYALMHDSDPRRYPLFL
jgi:pyruvate/2-oxoglutarate/acetoin dehydrogenase E1 component/TPP-dependent pyruvate/acetoin dehydrogenase alpha subunit